jgi:uncharacterized protein YycO
MELVFVGGSNMLRIIKKLFVFPLSLLLLLVWTFALSPFRIENSEGSTNILSSQTPKTTETALFGTPKAEKNSNSSSNLVLHNGSSITPSMIRPGDLLLIQGNTWIDKVIKRITGSPYSHVAGVVGPDEAVEIRPFQRTNYQKLENYTGRVDVFTCNSLTDDQRRKIVEHAVQKVGTKYDYMLVIWEASRYLFHWVWPYQAGDNSLCSTIWADAYRKAGIDLCPDIIYPSPGDLGKSPIIQKVERVE